MLLLGLAVPVTASFIIAAVIISPALTELGVPREVAYMFIFYYAVLSEVSPPTALSAFAAAAITGGNPFRTMMQTWRYSLPAFLVPVRLRAVAQRRGPAAARRRGDGRARGARLDAGRRRPGGGHGRGGSCARRACPSGCSAAVAAVALLYLEPLSIAVGAGAFALAVVVHLAARREAPARAAPAG